MSNEKCWADTVRRRIGRKGRAFGPRGSGGRRRGSCCSIAASPGRYAGALAVLRKGAVTRERRSCRNSRGFAERRRLRLVGILAELSPPQDGVHRSSTILCLTRPRPLIRYTLPAIGRKWRPFGRQGSSEEGTGRFEDGESAGRVVPVSWRVGSRRSLHHQAGAAGSGAPQLQVSAARTIAPQPPQRTNRPFR